MVLRGEPLFPHQQKPHTYSLSGNHARFWSGALTHLSRLISSYNSFLTPGFLTIISITLFLPSTTGMILTTVWELKISSDVAPIFFPFEILATFMLSTFDTG